MARAGHNAEGLPKTGNVVLCRIYESECSQHSQHHHTSCLKSLEHLKSFKQHLFRYAHQDLSYGKKKKKKASDPGTQCKLLRCFWIMLSWFHGYLLNYCSSQRLKLHCSLWFLQCTIFISVCRYWAAAYIASRALSKGKLGQHRQERALVRRNNWHEWGEEVGMGFLIQTSFESKTHYAAFMLSFPHVL